MNKSCTRYEYSFLLSVFTEIWSNSFLLSRNKNPVSTENTRAVVHQFASTLRSPFPNFIPWKGSTVDMGSRALNSVKTEDQTVRENRFNKKRIYASV